MQCLLNDFGLARSTDQEFSAAEGTLLFFSRFMRSLSSNPNQRLRYHATIDWDSFFLTLIYFAWNTYEVRSCCIVLC